MRKLALLMTLGLLLYSLSFVPRERIVVVSTAIGDVLGNAQQSFETWLTTPQAHLDERHMEVFAHHMLTQASLAWGQFSADVQASTSSAGR